MPFEDFFTSLEELRVKLLGFIIIIGLLGTLFFFMSVDFTESDNAQDNLEKVTTGAANDMIPIELIWIMKITEITKNPYLILLLILPILWLFGYLKK